MRDPSLPDDWSWHAFDEYNRSDEHEDDDIDMLIDMLEELRDDLREPLSNGFPGLEGIE